jgi:hypothetical protein
MMAKPPSTDSELREDMAEKFMSMQAELHDIDRWLMQGVANGRLSADRKKDIIYHAYRIADGIRKL